MSNELKDIVNRLSGYSDFEGWEILNAQKTEDGKWALLIDKIKLPEVPKEAVKNEG